MLLFQSFFYIHHRRSILHMLSSNEIIGRMKTVNRCMKDSMKEKDPDASIS